MKLLWVRLTFGQTYPQAETSCGQVWYYFGSGWNLARHTPQAETSCSQVWNYFGSGWHLVRSLGQVDIWSDISPGRDILWPSMKLLWVRLTFGQTYPQAGILWPSVILLWVSLTSGQIFGSGWHLVRHIPRQRHLVAKCDTTLGQVDIWSDLQLRLTLVRHIPRQRHLVAKYETTLGQVDIWSDIPPDRNILWPSVILLWVSLTSGQTYPEAGKSCSQVWYYFGSGWHLVRSLGKVDIWSDISPGRGILWPSVILPWVRLTFGQIFGSGWHLVRHIPRQRHLVAKCDTTLGQVDIWSDLQLRLTLVRHIPRQRHLVAKYETTLGQVDIWSDIPPGRNILWPSVILLWVSLTSGQTYPEAGKSCSQVWYYFGSGWHLVRSLGQVDIWSDISPGRGILWPSVILPWVRLAFGQIFGSGWHLVRHIPRQRHLVAKCDTTLGQVDIWSDLQLRLTLVRHIPRQRHLVAKYETTLGQVDIWSDIPPGRNILWPSVILLWVRLKFGQTYPSGRDIL